MPPIIGLTASKGHDEWRHGTTVVGEAYTQAILRAGGLPVVIPSDLAHGNRTALYGRLDGILFTGGGDIEPARYGNRDDGASKGVDPARDALELELLQTAMRERKPFLGICRGCQLVNVGLGGTLYTHIPDDVPGALDHDQPGDQKTTVYHAVQLAEGSRLATICSGTRVSTNSHHHQGLRRAGHGVRVVGRTADGLAEAIEVAGHPFGLAVQWHPEWLTDQECARALFHEFIKACASEPAGPIHG